jgi:hypothetical protein
MPSTVETSTSNMRHQRECDEELLELLEPFLPVKDEEGPIQTREEAEEEVIEEAEVEQEVEVPVPREGRDGNGTMQMWRPLLPRTVMWITKTRSRFEGSLDLDLREDRERAGDRWRPEAVIAGVWEREELQEVEEVPLAEARILRESNLVLRLRALRGEVKLLSSQPEGRLLSIRSAL